MSIKTSDKSGRRKSRHVASVGVLCAVVSVVGCAHPRKTVLETDPSTLDDVTFQAYIADLPVLTVDEACRAVLILYDGQDPSKNWQQRRERALERGLIRKTWRLSPEDVVDRGTVAYMICRTCRIRGGINAMVFGAVGIGDRRYAHRELVYLGLLSQGSVRQAMTGAQMVSLLGKADELMEKKRLYETETLDIGKEEDLVGPSKPGAQ